MACLRLFSGRVYAEGSGYISLFCSYLAVVLFFVSLEEVRTLVHTTSSSSLIERRSNSKINSNNNEGGDGTFRELDFHNNRRSFLQNAFLGGATTTVAPFISVAAPINSPDQKGLSLQQEKKGLEIDEMLLNFLPVKNSVFRDLEKSIWSVSVLRSLGVPDRTSWNSVVKRMQIALKYLDSQRDKLEPVFNQDDSTEVEIGKAERGEQLVEDFRIEINTIFDRSVRQDLDGTLKAQSRALRLLSEIGELLVSKFPYDIPEEGKFSYQPRLLGRAKVTFTITRMDGVSGNQMGKDKDDTILGNVTILADGFAAPISAGNFVDLCTRGFYTGLPVKVVRKRLDVKPFAYDDDLVAYDIANTIDKLTDNAGVVRKTLSTIINGEADDEIDESDTITTDIPILGSFNEGFYDPLTAKPRRIPLELVTKELRNNKAGGSSSSYKLSYEKEVLNSPSKLSKSEAKGKEKTGASALNFNIPGLVALNHPDKNLDGASSEFFSLVGKDRNSTQVKLLNGMYAPFGYIMDGKDIMEQLRPGDVITSTFVNEWGQLNLKRIRTSSLADAMNSNDDDEED